MKRFSRAAAVALIVAFSMSAAVAAPNCTTGKACGNACIAQDKECHVAPPPAKVCTTGKLCGNTCIAKDKVCRQ